MNIGIVPAKARSTRLPEKNFKEFWGGKNLTDIAIYRLLNAGCSYVLVSCEDWRRIDDLNRNYSNCREIVIHKRPDCLSKDPATIVDVVADLLRNYAGRLFDEKMANLVISLPTSPFISSSDIIDVLGMYEQLGQKAYLMSLSKFETPPFNAWSNKREGTSTFFPIEHTFLNSSYKEVQSTRCPDTYRSNGGIVVTCPGYFSSSPPYFDRFGYEFSDEKSFDIDTRFQFELAKIFANQNFTSPWWE